MTLVQRRRRRRREAEALTSEAFLDLRAADWTSGDWANRGSAGHALDAVQDGEVDQVTPTKVGGAVRVESSDPSNESEYGFALASALLDWPDTGGLSVLVDYTELDHGDPNESAKIMWKYPAVDLPTSLEGWVAENVPTQGGLLISGNDGSADPWPAGAAGGAFPSAATGVRRVLVFVVDRGDDGLSVYRDGGAVSPAFYLPMADGDQFATSAPLRIGADNDYFRIMAIARALTAGEVAVLSALVAS